MKTKCILLFITTIIVISACSQKQGQSELPDFDALWDYQYPDSTEMKFKELLPISREANEPEYCLQLITQIARAKGLQRQFGDAHALLDDVESELNKKHKAANIRYLLERGRLFNSSGQTAESVPLFMEAWEFGVKHKLDLYAIDAAHMMGIVEVPEKQLDWNLKALDLTERTEDKRAKGWLGSLYNNIGWTYHDLGEFQHAYDLFEKGTAWRKEVGDLHGELIGKWTMARALRSLKKTDEALEMQLALKAEYEEKQLAPDGYVFEELGELFLSKQNTAKSKENFAIAYELLSKDPWLVQNKAERLLRIKQLSK
jgi:tetratricopeptide (TPR) repeat protein